MHWVDFFLCFYLGFFGIHKFKEKRYGLGILYLCTFGLFGIGWLVDCIKLFIIAAKHSLASRNNKGVQPQGGNLGDINSYCKSCGKYLAEPYDTCPYCNTIQQTTKQSLTKNAWFWIAILGAIFNTSFALIATSGSDDTVEDNSHTEVVETQELPEWAGDLPPELVSEIEAAFSEIGENPDNIASFEFVDSKDTMLYTNNHYKVTFYFPWHNTKNYRLVTEDWFESEAEKSLYPYGYVSTIEFWTDDDSSGTCYWSHYGGGKYQESNPEQERTRNRDDIEISYKVNALEMAGEIKKDFSAAKSKYDGKWIEISGMITDISDAGSITGYYIYGKSGDSGVKLTCWVDESNDIGLKVGDAATFEGVVREVSIGNNTEIAHCVIK